MKFPRPRILPFAIALTIVSIGMRTMDIVTTGLSGAVFSTVTPAVAETSNSDSAKTDTAKTDDSKPADAEAKPSDGDKKVASVDAPTPGMPSYPPISTPDDSKSATELVQGLAEKRKQLDAMSQELDQREALLKAAEDRIDKKVAELSEMRTDLEKLLDIQKTKDDAQLASLVKIYENMKPKDAAAIFDSLELPVLVDVTSRMKEAKVAPVLAAMSPDRARILTVKLAEHRRVMDGAVADAKAALGDTAGDVKPADGATPASATAPDTAPASAPADSAKK
jgi:flagellar motility protein MotE (MotC chaperone)